MARKKYEEVREPTDRQVRNARTPRQLFAREIEAKNVAQEFYLQSLRENIITFGTGPAGTGKTFIATAVACEMLVEGKIDKIILTRPVVEAGENIGFLPGTLEEKLHPYLLPLYDGLNTHLGPKMTKELMADGRIEIMPLAFARGRSINKAFMLLDEAQNSTPKQMKMFLTRLGFDTMAAINGDPTQVDIDPRAENGLDWAIRKLKGKEPEIAVVEFFEKDIVRSRIVKKIVRHLESPDEKKAPTQQLNG